MKAYIDHSEFTGNFYSYDCFNCTISKEEFEEHFTKTNKSLRFTFNGWDGKSYEGESRTARIYTVDIPGYEHFEFIKVGKGVHYVTDKMVVEQATGESHPRVRWATYVARN